MYVSSWPGLDPALLFRAKGSAQAPFPIQSANATAYYIARYGIYHLFRNLDLQKGEAVLVPDYHSGLEAWAIKAAGAQVRFYRIGRDLKPDLDELSRLSKNGARVLYVIHFLGWPQPLAELRALARERGMMLIEDCAHALLSETPEGPLGSFGDYSVFCLYKTLPVPNGGLLVQNGETVKPASGAKRRCTLLSLLGRTAELQLEWIRTRHNELGSTLFSLKRAAGRGLERAHVKRAPVGDMGCDLSAVDLGMSPLSHRLLSRLDYDEIRRRRRENFLLLRQLLAGRVDFLDHDLGERVCPLFFPILVSDKHEVAEALRRRGIMAVEFWNCGDPEAERDGSDAQFLRDRVIDLPIHQYVTPEQIEYMANEVLTLVRLTAPVRPLLAA